MIVRFNSGITGVGAGVAVAVGLAVGCEVGEDVVGLFVGCVVSEGWMDSSVTVQFVCEVKPAASWNST